MAEENIETKRCTKCGKERELKYFSIRTDTGRLRTQCKQCTKGYVTDLFVKQENDQKLFDDGKKYCGKCGEIKSLSEFNRDKSTRFGYTSRCKECLHEISVSEERVYRERVNRIKYRYNGSDEDVNRIFDTHMCEICGTVFNSKTHKHVDHDHESGKIRGALCNKCNMGLGSFEDSINRMRLAISYLKKYKSE